MDARIIKTKQKVKDSLMFLLRSKRIGDVTISELCKKAGINRNTFYTHYSCPEDVLTDIANELSGLLFSTLEACEDESQIARIACEHVLKNIDMYKIIMENDGEKVYLKPAIDYSKNFVPYKNVNSSVGFPEQQIDIFYEFYIMGTIGIMKKWVANPSAISPEKLAEFINSTSKYLIAGIRASK